MMRCLIVRGLLSLVFAAGMGITLGGCPSLFQPATEDIAQEWISLTREALFKVDEGPTIEARTLFHVSAAMYEAWAAYDPVASGYFTGHRLKRPAVEGSLKNRAEALSHAVFPLLQARFARLAAEPEGTPRRETFDAFAAKMRRHGYITANGAPVQSEAQRLGRLIADIVLEYAANDGSNEANGYQDTTGYRPVNPPIFSAEEGTNGMDFPDNWQEIAPPEGPIQSYLTPHWGQVTPFALPPYDPTQLRFDPAAMPRFGDGDNQDYIENMLAVLRISSAMDPDSGPGAALINLSPGAPRIEAPTPFDDPDGHPLNPYTRRPYEDHIVPLGDYYRILAIYHDGKKHATPAPWWSEVATDILRGSGIVSQRAANKRRARDLGYDVKLYFALNAALHDVAIAIWEIKLPYNSARPISGIRFLAEAGELPLEPGFIELIGPDDPLAGEGGEHVGEYKVMAWAGPNQGVDWILATKWHPYQALGFVTPPFPGYVSGHTAFANAAAQVLTRYTGDPFFPGGLAALEIDELRFEDDMSGPVTWQAATYQDMADEVGLARVVTGVHIPADVRDARDIGKAIGAAAFQKALDYFEGRGVAVAKSH